MGRLSKLIILRHLKFLKVLRCLIGIAVACALENTNSIHADPVKVHIAVDIPAYGSIMSLCTSVPALKICLLDVFT